MNILLRIRRCKTTVQDCAAKQSVSIRAVVSRDMSRSRDTIFRSLGLEELKSLSRSRLGTLKSRKIGMSRQSRPYFDARCKIE